MKKTKIVIAGIIVLTVALVAGVSYALWQLTLHQESANVITTGCFEINFTDKNEINLQTAYPISDEEGMSLTPYTFTIENICNTNVAYQINLEELTTELKKLSKEYIKVSLNNSKAKLLNAYEIVEKTLSNAESSNKLTKGVLKSGDVKTFELRLWLDEDTPAISDVMNANFQSKITIIAVQKEGIPEVEVIAQEYLDGITVDISTVKNPKNETLTYFYQLNEEAEIESEENTHTFTGLSDGRYKARGRAETLDGVILEEKELDVTIAYEQVYVSALGNDETGNGSFDHPYATLQPAYNKVKSGGSILLLSDITATSATEMNIENKAVTLRSNGENIYSIFRGNILTNFILNVTNSSQLTTTNITFDGNNISANRPLLRLANKNTVINLNENTTIKNGITEASSSGGIDVYSATLNINGALITNNKTNSTTYTQGGGVYANDATVNLNSGIISNNACSTSVQNSSTGGGIFLYNSIFTMNGGSIINNKSGFGAGIYSWNSNKNTSTVITGGEIIDNVATISGGGIYIGGDADTYTTTVTIKGGTIANNTASQGANTYIYNNRGQIIDQR